MGILRWMSHEGDAQVAWDETDTASQEQAREMVERAFSEGRGVFVKREDGGHARASAFDPGAREILVIPPIKGG